MDVVSSQNSVFVPVLNKNVEARALKSTPGLVSFAFPDGSKKFIHYDEKKVSILLENLGHLLRQLQQERFHICLRYAFKRDNTYMQSTTEQKQLDGQNLVLS